MIEKKYEEIPGYESHNTYFQFDQYDPSFLKGNKNRFLFEMGMPLLPGMDPYESRQKYLDGIGVPPSWGPDAFFVNETTETSGLQIFGGAGQIQLIGPAEVTKDNVPTDLNPNTDFINPSYFPDLTTDVTGTRMVLEYNENALGSIDVNLFADLNASNYVRFFRSGYVEFSFKSTKENCIINSGTRELTNDEVYMFFWILNGNLNFGADVADDLPGAFNALPAVADDYPNYTAGMSEDGAFINLNIRLKDGKLALEFYDKYNRENVDFLFEGNQYIADGEWHHVVINFGRPGQIEEHGVKLNKKVIDFYIDGNLDKRFENKINDYQYFFPALEWFFINPAEGLSNVLKYEFKPETGSDPKRLNPRGGVPSITYNDTYGYNEIVNSDRIWLAMVENEQNKKDLFAGSLHTYAQSPQISLDPYEIKKRYRLWSGQYRAATEVRAYEVSAEMINPKVETNSKKVLKLYWDKLIDKSNFGVELDDKYQVESYSVALNTLNSKTEIYNLNNAIDKPIKLLDDVRIAFTDNIIIYGPGKVKYQNTFEGMSGLDSQSRSPSQTNPRDKTVDDQAGTSTGFMIDRVGASQWVGTRTDLSYSGIIPNIGDRVLLTNQVLAKENGVWVWNGPDAYLTRADDSLINSEESTIVYVSDGYEKGTYWKNIKAGRSLSEPQSWKQVESTDIEYANIAPISNERWKDNKGIDRFIDVLENVNALEYDAIVFMNYPESNDDVFAHFPNKPKVDVLDAYFVFLDKIKQAVSNGCSLHVSSPKLAVDLGIVKDYKAISQELEQSDPQSVNVDPFFNKDVNDYYDTHRINKYHLDTEIPGLTDKETYLLADFVNYLPEDEYDYQEWLCKYNYRQFGMQEGDEFMIPSLSSISFSDREDLPGNRTNSKKSEVVYAVKPSDILSGTVVTSLNNSYYVGETLTANPYGDYATTIVIKDGQLLGDYPIHGKIFVNCTEDSYAMSREDYNQASIQVVDQDTPRETAQTLEWQYSTTRLNRYLEKKSVRGINSKGQTRPTIGGGGPLIQSQTHSSDGVIRNKKDNNIEEYTSDFYPEIEEEIYPIQVVPARSMTWLGLEWLIN